MVVPSPLVFGVSSKARHSEFVRILHLFDEKGKLLISVGVLDNSPAIVGICRNKQRIDNTDICPTGALLLACFTLIGASHQLRRFIAL
jgi:hypothetical protein